MALQVGELVAKLGLDSRGFTTGLSGAQSRFRRVGSGLLTSARRIGLGLGAGLAVGGGLALNAWKDYDTGMREVFTLLPGLSEQARKQMSDDVLAFARDAGVVPDQVLPALYQALSAGVPQDNVFEFLTTANEAAVGGITDLETAVDGLSSVVNAYAGSGLTAQQASDQMFTTVRLGKTTFGELSDAMFQVAPISSSLGVSFGDVSAALAALTAKGVPTSVAATQIRGALAELGKEGTVASDIFRKAAGQTFPQFIAKGGNLAGALGIMEKAAADGDKSMIDMFGSIEAGQAALALTGEGAEAFNNALAEMEDSSGATGAAFGEMDSGVGRGIDRIKANLGVLAVQLGEKLAPAFEKVVAWVIDHWPQIEAVVRAVFEAVGKVVTWLVNNVIKPLAEFWRKHGDSILRNTRRVWSAVIDKVRAVVQGIIDFVKPIIQAIRNFWETNHERIKAIAERVWGNIKRVIEGVINVIKGIIQTVMALIKGDWKKVWEGIKNIIKGVWDIISGVVRQAIEDIRLVISLAWGALKKITSRVWGAIKGTILGVWNGIVDGIKKVWRTFKGWWNAAWRTLKKVVVGVGSAIAGAFRGVVNGVLAALEWLINKAIDALNRAIDFADKVAGPWINFGEISHVSIPRLHAGGTVPGPAGREVPIMALAGERVVRDAAGADTQPLLIHLDGAVYLDRDLVGELVMAGGHRQVLLRTGLRGS